VRTIVPLVPVTLTLALVKAEGEEQESVELEELLARWRLAGVRVQTMPDGAEPVRLTVPAKPWTLVAVIVEVPAVLKPVDTLVGLAVNEKSWMMKFTMTV
jgi:hypothetical protein